jgi:glycerol-3-phosphate dehydrogenase
MVAMAARLTQTVLNRCKPPHDGDVIVPIGTVCVLDNGRRSLSHRTDDGALGGRSAPRRGQVRSHRCAATGSCVRWYSRPAPPCRRWCDRLRICRSILKAAGHPVLPRPIIVDHGTSDGVPGLLSIIGGKLTTYRKMAQDVVDQAAARPRDAAVPDGVDAAAFG